MNFRKQKLSNVHVNASMRIYSPKQLKRLLPVSRKNGEIILRSREIVARIIAGKDPRMLAIVGPCSIHDGEIGVEFAHRLARLLPELQDQLHLIMRCYFEKPRTRLGWPGMIMDPYLDESYDVQQGLYLARTILTDITNLGISCGTEFLDPIVPMYIDDFIAWASIGARTTESQIHRYMASGLSMPVGFKNGTQGDIEQAANAMVACQQPHNFLGINKFGQIAMLRSLGHNQILLILRGSVSRGNYHAQDIEQATALLQKLSLPNSIVIDCSHGNSGRDIRKQSMVLNNIIDQRLSGRLSIIGFMLESNINEGSQTFQPEIKPKQYGVSITDPCISWDESESLLKETAARLRKR